MGIYKTTKCPHCQYTLEHMKSTGINDWEDLIGPPTEKCPNCQQEYKTGRSYWKIMTDGQKAKVLFRLIFGGGLVVIVLGTFFGGAILGYLFEWIKGGDLTGSQKLAPFVVAGIACVIFFVRSVVLQLREIKEYDPGLLQAAEAGDLARVKTLLDSNPSPTAELDISDLLIVAVVHGHKDMVEYLVAKGANVNYKTSGMTPLGLALKKNDIELADFLRSRGAG